MSMSQALGTVSLNRRVAKSTGFGVRQVEFRDLALPLPRTVTQASYCSELQV